MNDHNKEMKKHPICPSLCIITSFDSPFNSNSKPKKTMMTKKTLFLTVLTISIIYCHFRLERVEKIGYNLPSFMKDYFERRRDQVTDSSQTQNRHYKLEFKIFKTKGSMIKIKESAIKKAD